jgi:uncharacterized damage-inducible protein DinB
MEPSTLFRQFWTKEAPAMRQVLLRIPEGSDYRPDPKSRTAREIAWLIVHEEIALVEGLERGSFDWTELPAPATMKEILVIHDNLHATCEARFDAVNAEHWTEPLPFVVGGNEVMRATGTDMAWGFLLDLIHHRGQLTTYLRPMGSTVPQIYGPSADEP